MAHSVFSIIGFHGKEVFGNKWIVDNSKGNIIIVHGMGEYSYRYNEFALYLNKNGYDVFALDHLGHGRNCPAKEGLGIWPRDGFERCVDNVYALYEVLRKENPNTLIFSHSMGSFMMQLFMERYPGACDKIVLCGTSGPSPMYGAGAVVAKIIGAFTNKNKPSKFLTNVAFGSYNNRYKDVRTEFDWLSVNKENVDKYLADDYCGFTQSVMFYISFTENLAKLHKKKMLEKISKKQRVLLVAGLEDPVGGFGKTVEQLHNIYLKLGLDSKMILYPELRHEILNEDGKEKIMDDILSFFNS